MTHPWLKSYPPGVDWHAELEPQSLPNMFDEAVASHWDNVCTSFLGAEGGLSRICPSRFQAPPF